MEEGGILSKRDITNTGLWRLERDHRLGRYLVATRDIQPGEEILREKAVMWGTDTSQEIMVCLGCVRQVPPGMVCSSCLLPLCSHCVQESIHSKLECKHFTLRRNNNISRTDNSDTTLYYTAILAVRILSLKDRDPDLYSQFCILESLVDQWRGVEGWMEAHRDTVNLICTQLSLPVTEDEVIEVIARCCTNTFSKYLEVGEKGKVGGLGVEREVGTKIRVTYILSSMVAHSCAPNTEQAIHSLSEGLPLSLRATTPIHAGEQIVLSYTELLAPAQVRQEELLTHKLFLCSCPRCLDPTDLSTYTSALHCLSCMRNSPCAPPGLLLCLPSQPVWQCSVCKAKFPSSAADTMVLRIHQEMEAMLKSPDLDPPTLEKFLSRYSKVLGSSHGMLLHVQYILAGQLGRSPGYLLNQLSPSQVARKRSLCECLLTVLNTLQPGCTARRGVILYELHVTLLVTARNKLEQKPQEARKELRQSLECLKEALDILRMEPRMSFSGQLYTGGKASLVDVQTYVNSVT